MSLFAVDNRILASEQANKLLKTWENGLSLRISLQKVLEIANKLPVYDFSEIQNNNDNDNQNINNILTSFYNILSKSSDYSDKLNISDISDSSEIWEIIDSLNIHMSSNWEGVLNKWHTRLQFGSKGSGYKMKTFKQTFWDQVRKQACYACARTHTTHIILTIHICID